MGIAVIPAPSSGITVSDGNTAGWNLGGEQWELISSYRSTSSVTSINFSSIPQTYRKLVLTFDGIYEATGGEQSVFFRLNGTSTDQYSAHGTKIVNSGATEEAVFNNINSNAFYVCTDPNLGGARLLAGMYEIFNYTSTSAKVLKGVSFYENSGGYGTRRQFDYMQYREGSTTNAITSLSIIMNGNFYISSGGNYSGVQLFGVK